DPNTLAVYRLPITTVIQAVRNSNAEVSGRVLEMTGTEYVIRGLGYFRSIEDIELVTVGTDGRGTPILVRDIARVKLGTEQSPGGGESAGTGQSVWGVGSRRAGQHAMGVR